MCKLEAKIIATIGDIVEIIEPHGNLKVGQKGIVMDVYDGGISYDVKVENTFAPYITFYNKELNKLDVDESVKNDWMLKNLDDSRIDYIKENLGKVNEY